jgi:CBS domain-containing protein
MLLRERAWDIMRADYVTVRESDNLRDVANRLREAMKHLEDHSGGACAVVLTEDGGFRGVVTAWWLLLSLAKYARKDALKPSQDPGDEEKFTTAIRKVFSRRVDETIEHDVPVVRPADSLSKVLDVMLATKRRWAVVMEGSSVLGIVSGEDIFMQIEWEQLEEERARG